MPYDVKTRVFEGPIDLLLQLIASRQLVITEISLTGIVTEYLDTLTAMRDLDLEVTSEFLLIAATLVQLKARYLLPDESENELDDDLAVCAERDQLLARLLSCLTFKDVAAVLSHRMESNRRYVPRMSGLDLGLTTSPPLVHLTVTPSELALLAGEVFAMRGSELELDLDHLELELPSVADAITDIRYRVPDGVEMEFDALVLHCKQPREIVAYFLAVLELVRWGIVGIKQAVDVGPIAVSGRADTSATTLQSEWST